MGQALQMVSGALDIKQLGKRGVPPVLVLVSDGQPTDDFEAGLKALLDKPWGKKSVRVAIAIGRDADKEMLRKFISNPNEMPVFEATNKHELIQWMKFASTTAVQTTTYQTPPPSPVAIPQPEPGPDDDDGEVW